MRPNILHINHLGIKVDTTNNYFTEETSSSITSDGSSTTGQEKISIPDSSLGQFLTPKKSTDKDLPCGNELHLPELLGDLFYELDQQSSSASGTNEKLVSPHPEDSTVSIMKQIYLGDTYEVDLQDLMTYNCATPSDPHFLEQYLDSSQQVGQYYHFDRKQTPPTDFIYPHHYYNTTATSYRGSHGAAYSIEAPTPPCVSNQNPKLHDGEDGLMELYLLVSKSCSHWNPKSVGNNYCAYLFAAEYIDVYDKEFECLVLDKIRHHVIKSCGHSSESKIQSIKVDVCETFSNAKKYLMRKITPHIIGIGSSQNVPISLGMSVEDIRSLLISNERFFHELSERCKQLKTELLGCSDITGIVQRVIIFRFEDKYINLDVSPTEEYTVLLINSMRKALVEHISYLPEKIRSIIENSSSNSIKDWLFSHCHGAYIYNQSLERVYNICSSIHKKILEDASLTESLTVIAQKISSQAVIGNNGRSRYRKGVVKVLQSYKLKDTPILNYIGSIADGSIYLLVKELSNSFVIYKDSVINLNASIAKKMAVHISKDIKIMSLRDYKKLCSDHSKSIAESRRKILDSSKS